MKYTKRIKIEAPWAYNEASIKWYRKISEGLNLVKYSKEIKKLSEKMVTINTEMKCFDIEVNCYQGTTIREKYLFPWKLTQNNFTILEQ